MNAVRRSCAIAALLLFTAGQAPYTTLAAAPDPLPSWNEGAARQSILTFVADVTESSSPHYVKPEDRIAVFDQDGTTWVEHPIFAQAAFALDRVRELAPTHPEWQKQEPFRTVLSGNHAAIAKLGKADLAAIVAATQTGMNTDVFRQMAAQWIATAKHPRFHRLYTELVYQPMLELMSYLRDNGFRTYIVTGGEQEFVRSYSRRVYGIPPEQVVGSSFVTRFAVNNGKPELIREPKLLLLDDHGGKPVGINLVIGKRPLAAFGNSTGDEQMLQWTQAAGGPRLEMLIYHDDPVREYAYGPAGGLPATPVGTFSQPLMDYARRHGWNVVSIKRDWNRIFCWER